MSPLNKHCCPIAALGIDANQGSGTVNRNGGLVHSGTSGGHCNGHWTAGAVSISVEGEAVGGTERKLVEGIVVVLSVSAGVVVEDDERLMDDDADERLVDDAPTASSPEPHEEPMHATNAIMRLARHRDDGRALLLMEIRSDARTST